MRTSAGCFFGVLSTGAGASVPWNVEPTTTVSIARWAFARSCRRQLRDLAVAEQVGDLARGELRVRSARGRSRPSCGSSRSSARCVSAALAGHDDLVAALAELVRRRSTPSPSTPLPFRTLIEMRLGGGDFDAGGLAPERRRRSALRGASTSGVWKSPHRRLRSTTSARSARVVPGEVVDLRLEEVPRRQAVREERVALDRVLERAAAGLADLDVVRDRADDLRATLKTEKLLETCSFSALTNCCWRASR